MLILAPNFQSKDDQQALMKDFEQSMSKVYGKNISVSQNPDMLKVFSSNSFCRSF